MAAVLGVPPLVAGQVPRVRRPIWTSGRVRWVPVLTPNSWALWEMVEIEMPTGYEQRAMGNYPRRDLTPEHTLRGNDHDSDTPIHAQVAAAYAYVDKIVDAADVDVGGAPAWHGWALREAFLAGCSHAAIGAKR